MNFKRMGLILGGIFAVSVLGGCGGSSSQVKDHYEFVYNVNYDGGNNRVVNVKHGQRASDWSAKRSGYELDDWYDSSQLNEPFDFNTPITSDTTVYAKWNLKVEDIPVEVTFDYNYGDRKPTIVTAYKGRSIAESIAPDPGRLGYSVAGWYFEKTFETKFQFGVTIVEEPITLYADYNDVSNFKYDNEGKVVFNNVSFNLVVNDSFLIGENYVKSVVSKFNLQYAGAIQANVIKQGDNNQDISLKFHQTNVLNRSGDYYDMQDVLDLAKVTFDHSKFDQVANQDNYMNGKLKSYPIGHVIPALVFNKEKLQTYFPAYKNEGKLPSTYAEFKQAMEAFAAAENKPAIVTDSSWPFYEGASNLAWSQNDIMMYDYDVEEAKYYTKWTDTEGAVVAKNAAKSIYEMFGKNGSIKGLIQGDYGSFVYDRVSKGDSLFALTSNNDTLNAASLANTEIMPVTNLFNITNADNSRNFIGNYSIGITSSGPSDLYKIAAAGVFADYFSKNATKIGERGLVPANLDVQSGEFKTSTNQTTVKLRAAADLDKMISLPGHWNEYTVFNNKDNGYFDMIASLDEWNETIITNFVSMVGNAVEGFVG